jgi:ribose-phosphate pyrophosphokinase
MKTVAKLFKVVGATKIVIVDVHSKIALKHFKIPVKNISAAPELAKYFARLNLNNPLVVSPDFGGVSRASEFAKLLNLDYTALLKRRDRKTGKVEIKSSSLRNVRGRDMIIVDDMISTGGSIIKAAEFLKKQNCGRVFVACTHALLINDAEKKIRRAGVSKIISTNTIPKKTAVVDSSEIIVDAIS